MDRQTVFFDVGPRIKGGYPARPGTGPAGRTCQDCANYRRFVTGAGNTFRKCHVIRYAWTHGPGSDIKARSPACRYFEDRIGDQTEKV